jgi:cation-transporting ATPase E
VAELSRDARRVLLVAHSDRSLDEGTELPDRITPTGLVVLAEQLRSDAGSILEYFGDHGVAVKIISGDSADTVSAVAGRLGVAGATEAVDLRSIADDALGDVIEGTTVFGRVLPEQKRALVTALQAAGHTVAMTGDGVNDIPSLKQADIGIAMDTATSATKAVAQLVLLDGRFERLPGVVGEGQRVVANMERVSSLFVTKTVYAAVFALTIGLSGAIFPFLPRHMSLVSELTIGVPAFLLSFRAADRPCQPGYLSRVASFALPAGAVAAAVTLTTYWLARAGPFSATLEQARTLSTFSLATVALWVLYRLVRPLDRYESALLATLVAALVVVGATPVLRRFYALDWPGPPLCAAAAALTGGSLVAFQASLAWGGVGLWARVRRATSAVRSRLAR